jgi:hypothetical protein
VHRGRPTDPANSVRAVEHVFGVAHTAVAELPECQLGTLVTGYELVHDLAGVEQRLVHSAYEALDLISTGLHKHRVVEGNEHVSQFHAGAARIGLTQLTSEHIDTV